MITTKVHIMQKESDPLNLRALPLVAPPRDGWADVQATLVQDRRRRRVLRIGGGALALAASVTLAIGLYLQTPSPGRDTAPASETVAVTESQQPDSPVLTVDALIALSQQLESRLRGARDEFGPLPTDQLIYQVELEDMIALVDEELSETPDSRTLWSQRVNLLLDLDQLYRNQLRRDYDRMASL
jgi:hypothetical protein